MKVNGTTKAVDHSGRYTIPWFEFAGPYVSLKGNIYTDVMCIISEQEALGLAIGSDIVVLGQVIDADWELKLILYPCSVSTN